MSRRMSELSTAQHKLYRHQKVFPQDVGYNLARVIRFTGDIDAERLRRSVETVLRASVAMNTSFEEHEGKVRAVHDTQRRYEVTLERRSGDASTDIVQENAARLAEPIPMDRWPLYDYRIIEDEGAAYLSLTMSHLLCDVFGFYHFGKQVERVYFDADAEVTGAQWSPADFLDLQKPGQEANAFFKAMLHGRQSLAMEQLETDRDADGVLRGTNLWVPLDKELSSAIGETVRELGVRPFSFFLAVHLLLLGELTGTRSVTTGVPLGNRRQDPRQRETFGYFVNTLPLAVDLDDYTTLGELAHEVERRVAGLIRHEHYDLGAHAQEVFAQGAAARLLPSSSFTYYREPVAFPIGDLGVEDLPVPRADLIYPLVANVEDLGGQYGYHLSYSDTLVPSDPRQTLIALLRSVARGRDVVLAEAHGVSEETARRIDALVNRHASFPTASSLQALFEEQARQFPERPAVESGPDRLTYAELNAQANRLARQLKEQVPGDYVAVAMDRGCELIAVLLGVLKAGKTYVPLDPAAPASRVQHIRRQFDALPVVTGAGIFPGLDPAERLPLEELFAASAVREAGDLPEADLRERTAYVIFTSGSTGMPKGVQVSHAAVLRLFLSGQEHFAFGPEDTWCLFHSYAFDFAVWEMYGALLHGGRLVVPAESVRKSPQEFAAFLADTKVSVLNQTPSAFRRLSRALDQELADRMAVRTVIFGGEALQFQSLERWFALFGERAEVANMYGITETTVHVTHYRVTLQDVVAESASVIGKPLADLSVHIVDGALRSVPVGVPGEMLVGGAGVAHGYLGQPELTDQRFVSLPGRTGRFYRSGDLATVREDGNLIYLGRMDQQVQLRGYRVELGEIETALRGLPGVADCAVLLDGQADDPRLIAFVVGADADADAGDRALRMGMKERVPGYMLPSLYIPVPSLPLTVNGKVDAKSLPWPGQQQDAPLSLAETGSEVDDTQALVARVWREVLGFSEFTQNDRFFELGGNSVQVIQVHTRLQAETGARELELIDLFEFTTVRELAAHLNTLTQPAGSAK